MQALFGSTARLVRAPTASKALSKALSLIFNSSKETPLESSCIRFTKSLTRSIWCSVTVRRTFKANSALSSFLLEHCTASTPLADGWLRLPSVAERLIR
uniref:Uncharacterized protein n=1 Tax=Glossina palpalis gambiensis TaxID=67801 RepID=A0A1B0BUQ4_9MUSC